MKAKVNLVTMSDVIRFVAISTKHPDSKIVLTNEDGSFIVNGKSLIGAVASMEWINIYVVSDVDLYSELDSFIIY